MTSCFFRNLESFVYTYQVAWDFFFFFSFLFCLGLSEPIVGNPERFMLPSVPSRVLPRSGQLQLPFQIQQAGCAESSRWSLLEGHLYYDRVFPFPLGHHWGLSFSPASSDSFNNGSENDSKQTSPDVSSQDLGDCCVLLSNELAIGP